MKSLLIIFCLFLNQTANAMKCILLNAAGGEVVQKLHDVGSDTYEVHFNNPNPRAARFRIILHAKTVKFDSPGRLGWKPLVFIDLDTQSKIEMKMANGFTEKMPFYQESVDCLKDFETEKPKKQETTEAQKKPITEAKPNTKAQTNSEEDYTAKDFKTKCKDQVLAKEKFLKACSEVHRKRFGGSWSKYDLQTQSRMHCECLFKNFDLHESALKDCSPPPEFRNKETFDEVFDGEEIKNKCPYPQLNQEFKK